MTISGTITQAGSASEPSGQFQVRYQDIIIADQNGTEWHGRIGSKQGYQANTPIDVTVEEKREQDGTPYNYFRKFNPQYEGRTTSPCPPQAPSRPPQSHIPQNKGNPPADNGQREIRIIRGNALNAIMSATDVPLDMVNDYLLAGVYWIMTGKWELNLLTKPAKHIQTKTNVPKPGDDIPF